MPETLSSIDNRRKELTRQRSQLTLNRNSIPDDNMRYVYVATGNGAYEQYINSPEVSKQKTPWNEKRVDLNADRHELTLKRNDILEKEYVDTINILPLDDIPEEEREEERQKLLDAMPKYRSRDWCYVYSEWHEDEITTKDKYLEYVGTQNGGKTSVKLVKDYQSKLTENWKWHKHYQKVEVSKQIHRPDEGTVEYTRDYWEGNEALS